ncbi:hypothetical protein RSK20926_22289 [Roseobacter sp. SK209-2-6]|uniref:DUF4265 domain-containing protein n=1 Tax=Roseobacter sp. SK209-2-6 TaxID=388739 RepID=UPI0000F3F3D3|nr:DUF4265 domain-containing protein [Roseobacter sp. SK209-2-6]EBA16501.1 hypothetical protein RSK20926_22289 [Roseobacter sp. SK209-2-6]
MEKMHIRLPEDAWHGYSMESLWVTRLGPDRFRLENSPFFGRGLSYKDQVQAIKEDDALVFERILAPSGHSTYRIILLEEAEKDLFHRYWAPIAAEGCTYEQGSFGYDLYSVDVPKNTDLEKVFVFLETGFRNKVWDFEEGHSGHQN